MSLFGNKSIRCPAGEWTTLVSNFGSGYAKTFTVTLASAAGPVSGEWVEKRHWWIFPQAEAHGALAPKLEFHRRWINAIYKIKIRPDQDVVATIA